MLKRGICGLKSYAVSQAMYGSSFELKSTQFRRHTILNSHQITTNIAFLCLFKRNPKKFRTLTPTTGWMILNDIFF